MGRRIRIEQNLHKSSFSTWLVSTKSYRRACQATLIFLGLIAAIGANAQTHEVIVSKGKFNVKTATDIPLKPGSSGSIDLRDTSKVFMFQVTDPSVTTLYYSTSPTPAPPDPIKLPATVFISQSGLSVGVDFIGGSDMNDNVRYAFTQAGKFKVSAEFSRGETNPATGGKAEVRVNTSGGTLAGTLTFRNTGGWGSYITESVGEVTIPAGTTSIYLIFKTTQGNGNFKSFTFTP